MYSWKNYKHKVQKYYKFSKSEMISLAITIPVLAFVVSFTEWGTTEFNISMGLFNFFNALLIVTAIILVQESAHKLFALTAGHRTEYKHWTIGLVIALVIVFFSNGMIKFMAAGGILMTHMAVHRIGRFRYGPNFNVMGWIAMTGPLSNIFLAIVFKLLASVAPNAAIFAKAMNIAILFAVFNMIPFPPFNGHQLFFGSRYIYIMVLGFIIGAGASLYYFGVVGTIVAAILFGILAAILYFRFVDEMW